MPSEASGLFVGAYPDDLKEVDGHIGLSANRKHSMCSSALLIAKVDNLTKGKCLCSRCRIATSWLARLKGLILVRSLSDDEGLLLVTAKGGVHTLFMRFPIDVAYINANLKVVAIKSELRSWHLWMPRVAGTLLALELPSGRLAETQTQIGDQLSITLLGWE